MEDWFETEAAAAVHFREQVGSKLMKLAVPSERGFEYACEHIIAQQLGILSKHAEDELIHEVRYYQRRMALLAQSLRQISKLPGNLLSDCFAGQGRSEAVGIAEEPSQLLSRLSQGEIREFECMNFRDRIGPVCSDYNPASV